MDQPQINAQVQQQLQVLAASVNRLEKDINALRQNFDTMRQYVDIVDAVAFASMYFHEWGPESEFELSDKKIKMAKKRVEAAMDAMNEYTKAAMEKAKEAEKKNGKKSSTIITD